MINFRLILQYDGGRYKGWQRQKLSEQTIQGKVEHVLSVLEGESVTIDGAGRTDAGVHARAQVANVRLMTTITPSELCQYMNRYLPEDIRVVKVEQAGPRFHSRLNATGKTYRYQCIKKGQTDVFARNYAWCLSEQVDVAKMQEAANRLLGTHDFAGFCSHASKKKSTVRTVDRIEIVEEQDRILFWFHGNGFLYNMVRIVTGTLIEVGEGKRDIESLSALLDGGQRKEAGATAPAKGLTLWQVDYD